MHLKRIELVGFKTFPDHTEVLLAPGITAVVGPNGCGKSNLMDAVRWVLGEQRARIMRGGKMEEVIFSGTPQRPAMSAAEVTLTIDNQSGHLMSDFTEIAVSRRLDRSGDSEYRLNGRICRLKDLNDLFLDTGMGSHGYAVIQTGMIDAIISENADERRFLFEEAAGISKYKRRQREAVRKMEATAQDLLRLTDLSSEVATRVRSLARQKGMAERQSRLREKWRAFEVAIAAREYRRLIVRIGDLDRNLVTAQDRANGLLAACETLELERQSLRLNVDEAERVAQAAADLAAGAAARVQAHQSQQVRWEDRRRHLEEDRGRIHERRTLLASRTTALSERREQAVIEQAEATRERERIVIVDSDLAKKYTGTKAVSTAAAELLARVDRERTEAEHAHLRLVTEKAAVESRREEYGRYQTEMRERQTRNRLAIETAAGKIAADTDALAAARGHLDTARRKQQEERDLLSERETRIVRLDEEITHRRARLTELREGRELVASLIARGEGLGQAVSKILSDTAKWEGRACGWVDRLRPHDGWASTVAVVLSEHLGALWCRDADVARDLIAALGENPVGYAGVLDPGLLRGDGAGRPKIDDPAFVGWLSEKIDCDDSDRPWVEALYGRVAVVESDGDARRVFAAQQGRLAVASRSGVVISPPGVISTGTDQGEPVVGRRDRLKILDETIGAAERTLAESEGRVDPLSRERDTGRGELESAIGKLTESEEQVSQLERQLEAEHARMTEYRRLEEEMESDLGQTEAGIDAGDPSGATEEELKSACDAAIVRHQEVLQQVTAAEEESNRVSVAVNRTRVEAVEVQARIEAAELECRRRDEARAEIAVEQEELSRRQSGIDVEVRELKEKLLTAKRRHEELTGECERLEGDRREARAELAGRKETMTASEEKLREARHQRDGAEKERGKIEIERSGIAAEAGQWTRRVLDTHQVDLAKETIEDSPLPDDELRAKVEDAQRAMDRLGPVNPLALQEWETENERLKFLEDQIGDLQAAKKSLTETIVELNQTAGRRFLETFDAARVHFQDVFTELFRGGEADVKLVDPERPLESPIEVYARPRGKKFIGLRQLSGGERALTALALLFALYLVKPSPFCILDEVDAPLDDANCGRFLRLLHRFKSRTQFIIVTHNKLTMDAAEILYGVTMEDPGVSKIVSVRLTHTEEGEHVDLAAVDTGAPVEALPAEAPAESIPAAPSEN